MPLAGCGSSGSFLKFQEQAEKSESRKIQLFMTSPDARRFVTFTVVRPVMASGDRRSAATRDAPSYGFWENAACDASMEAWVPTTDSTARSRFRYFSATLLISSGVTAATELRSLSL